MSLIALAKSRSPNTHSRLDGKRWKELLDVIGNRFMHIKDIQYRCTHPLINKNNNKVWLIINTDINNTWFHNEALSSVDPPTNYTSSMHIQIISTHTTAPWPSALVQHPFCRYDFELQDHYDDNLEKKISCFPRFIPWSVLQCCCGDDAALLALGW